MMYIQFGESEVVIDNIIDGNLFVIADSVTINSQVGGDAFIIANKVNIGEQGYIFSNLFVMSNDITISGVVYDLYSISTNLSINGYIYRDIRSTSSNMSISGVVGRNAYVASDNLNIFSSSDENSEDSANANNNVSRSVIIGNLNYTSKQEASIPNGIVGGEVNFNKEIISNNDNNMSNYLLSLGTFVITIAVIWLICLWIAPKFLKSNTSLITTKKILPVIGLGIITPIVLALLSILLLLIGITSTLGLLLLVALIVLVAISTSIFVISVNNIVCNKLKITKNIITFGILIISSIVLWLIGLIPYIGSIVSFAAVILGLGIIVYNLLFKNKKEKSEVVAE